MRKRKNPEGEKLYRGHDGVHRPAHLHRKQVIRNLWRKAAVPLLSTAVLSGTVAAAFGAAVVLSDLDRAGSALDPSPDYTPKFASKSSVGSSKITDANELALRKMIDSQTRVADLNPREKFERALDDVDAKIRKNADLSAEPPVIGEIPLPPVKKKKPASQRHKRLQ